MWRVINEAKVVQNCKDGGIGILIGDKVYQCSTTEQLNVAIGDIDAALDIIIAIQNELIGGGS